MHCRENRKNIGWQHSVFFVAILCTFLLQNTVKITKKANLGEFFININVKNPFIRVIRNNIQHYNHDKYWDMRKIVINNKSKVPKIIKLFYLLRIKRMDSFNNASMGTDLGNGAFFEEPPNLPHGLNGIIIGHDVKIGKNCTIFQQVTVVNNSVSIGDNCILGAGSKILDGVQIGNNVKIGANAVVTKNVPDNCTVVGVPAKIIRNDNIHNDVTTKEVQYRTYEI